MVRRCAQELEEIEAFDGVWACASLLHVPAIETPAVLARLARALRPGGVLYASYKLGQGERQAERFFHDQNEDSLAEARSCQRKQLTLHHVLEAGGGADAIPAEGVAAWPPRRRAGTEATDGL